MVTQFTIGYDCIIMKWVAKLGWALLEGYDQLLGGEQRVVTGSHGYRIAGLPRFTCLFREREG